MSAPPGGLPIPPNLAFPPPSSLSSQARPGARGGSTGPSLPHPPGRSDGQPAPAATGGGPPSRDGQFHLAYGGAPPLQPHPPSSHSPGFPPSGPPLPLPPGYYAPPPPLQQQPSGDKAYANSNNGFPSLTNLPPYGSVAPGLPSSDGGMSDDGGRSETSGGAGGGGGGGKKGTRLSPEDLEKEQLRGRWTEEEHQAFLSGLRVYGREWKRVAADIPTRTSAQIRSHAQKYFAKLSKSRGFAVSNGGGMALDADGTAMYIGSEGGYRTKSLLTGRGAGEHDGLPPSHTLCLAPYAYLPNTAQPPHGQHQQHQSHSQLQADAAYSAYHHHHQQHQHQQHQHQHQHQHHQQHHQQHQQYHQQKQTYPRTEEEVALQSEVGVVLGKLKARREEVRRKAGGRAEGVSEKRQKQEEGGERQEARRQQGEEGLKELASSHQQHEAHPHGGQREAEPLQLSPTHLRTAQGEGHQPPLSQQAASPILTPPLSSSSSTITSTVPLPREKREREEEEENLKREGQYGTFSAVTAAAESGGPSSPLRMGVRGLEVRIPI